MMTGCTDTFTLCLYIGIYIVFVYTYTLCLYISTNILFTYMYTFRPHSPPDSMMTGGTHAKSYSLPGYKVASLTTEITSYANICQVLSSSCLLWRFTTDSVEQKLHHIKTLFLTIGYWLEGHVLAFLEYEWHIKTCYNSLTKTKKVQNPSAPKTLKIVWDSMNADKKLLHYL